MTSTGGRCTGSTGDPQQFSPELLATGQESLSTVVQAEPVKLVTAKLMLLLLAIVRLPGRVTRWAAKHMVNTSSNCNGVEHVSTSIYYISLSRPRFLHLFIIQFPPRVSQCVDISLYRPRVFTSIHINLSHPRVSTSIHIICLVRMFLSLFL